MPETKHGPIVYKTNQPLLSYRSPPFNFLGVENMPLGDYVGRMYTCKCIKEGIISTGYVLSCKEKKMKKRKNIHLLLQYF